MEYFVVYNKETTKIIGSKHRQYFKGLGCAKTHLTKMERMGYRREDYAIAEMKDFYDNIEKTVVKVNAMSGYEYSEKANTPMSCSPSSETYWSM